MYKNKLIIPALIVTMSLSGCMTTKEAYEPRPAAHKVQDLAHISETTFENKMKARYNQIYYFPFDSSTLNEEDIESIKVQAAHLIKTADSKLVIHGHTDSRGSPEYNTALGYRRAQKVAALLKEYGVSDSQISIVSFGQELPSVLGDTEAAHKWNRRAELKYGNNR